MTNGGRKIGKTERRGRFVKEYLKSERITKKKDRHN